MQSLFRISFLLLTFTLLNSGLLLEDIQDTLISKKEYQLYDSLNKYRVTNGLHVIPLSVKLSKVAQVHCEDLEKNYKRNKVCNLHSWSATSERWTSCCYTSDHKKAKCMWDKPKEIAGYASEGYEIAYYNSNGFSAYRPLESWKKSKKGHNMVIVNSGQWNKVKWEAIGIGLTEHYACVWFGTLKDTSSLN